MFWNLGGVEPDGVERVEVEGRVGAIEDRPRAQLRGREPRDDDPRELPVIELRAAVGHGRPHGPQRHRRQHRRRDGQVAASAPPRRHHGPLDSLALALGVGCLLRVPRSQWLCACACARGWSGKARRGGAAIWAVRFVGDRHLGGSRIRLRFRRGAH